MRLFGGGESKGANANDTARTARPSSGWAQLSKSLKEQEGLRVLDIGPTSSSNINLLTGFGHSVYMANLVGEAAEQRWRPEDPEAPFPAEEFVRENLDFSGRLFDVVLFWDSADYFAPVLRSAVVQRLHEVMAPGGQLLALFHIKPEKGFHRYHLRDDGQVDAQPAGSNEVKDTLTNRQIEQLFHDFSSYRFFLAKDNLREVIVTR